METHINLTLLWKAPPLWRRVKADRMLYQPMTPKSPSHSQPDYILTQSIETIDRFPNIKVLLDWYHNADLA